MKNSIYITEIKVIDKRFPLLEGAGSDAVHTVPTYAYAVCQLKSDSKIEGIGLAFTLGTGNELVCQAIDYLSKYIKGKEINELMADFGTIYNLMTNDPNFRWLGPHKGVVHLAIAAIVNACFDLWAKARQVPLWKLLIDLTPEELVNTISFTYVNEILTKQKAIELLEKEQQFKQERLPIISKGYKGYDTSVGWFNYSDEKVKENAKKAIDNGFTAMKLKVGSKDQKRDLRRAHMLRNIAGEEATLMFDANQQWDLKEAISFCNEIKGLNPYWVEEPTHPDDIQAHVTLKNETGIDIALGEHVPNYIMFKNFLQSKCMSYNQVDVVRVGGVSEFLLISLLSKVMNVPVLPHVGDMGQIHQHLVLFNHISVGHPALFLEHIPHLKQHFKYPAIIKDGNYITPQIPGMSSDLF